MQCSYARGLALSCLAAPALLHSPFAEAQGIETRNHRALSLLFLRFLPAQPPLLAGQSEWALSYTNANDFRVLGEGKAMLQEDYEVSRLTVRHRRGVRGGEVYIEAPLVHRGGGFMDSIIEWFHRLFGFPPQPRDEFPRGRAVISAGDIQGGSAFGLGDAQIGYRHNVAQEVSVRLAIEVPTGNASDLTGSGGIDIGASVDSVLPVGRDWNVSLQAAVVFQGGSIPDARRVVSQQAAALTWNPNSRDRWTLQWQGESAPVTTGFAGADAPHRLLSLGYSRQMSETENVQVFISEDGDFLNWRAPALANIGPDFTFGLAYSVRR